MRRLARQRTAMAVGLVLVAAVIVVDLGQASPAAAATVTINATADSYVSGASPASNYGTSTTLIANATGPVYTHLMFKVTGSGGATSATLQVYSTSSGTTKTQVYAEPATWTETSLTYANQPVKGALVGALSTLTANTYSTLTVPLTGDGSYAYVLTTGATANRNMTSRETSTPPQLILSGTTTTSSTTSASPTTSTTTTTSASPTTSTTTTTTSTTTTGGDPVVVAAGDIACSASDASFNNLNGTATACRSKYTEQIIQQINPVFLLPLGDEQYNSGSPADFAASYARTWGLSKNISKPVVGNHEYGTSNAAGYFGYFGSAAGNQGAGYYSYDVGAWHVVAINTECTRINGAAGCAVGSLQETWLKNDLAAHPTACTLVYGHRPRWASSSFASSDIAPLVDDMVAAHVDLYVTGHAHSYERFAPQDAAGNANANGVTEMVIGTGGAFYTGIGTIAANSQVRAKNLYGVEKFTLHPSGWDYTYVPENSTFTDTGTAACH